MGQIFSGNKVSIRAGEISGGQKAPSSVTPGNLTGKVVARLTDRSINLEKNLLETEEVRTSRMQADVRHGFTTVSASLGFEIASPDADSTGGATPGSAQTEDGQKFLVQSVLEGATRTAPAALSASGDAVKFGDVLVNDTNGDAYVYVADGDADAADALAPDGTVGAISALTVSFADYFLTEDHTLGNGTPKAYVLERVFTPSTTVDASNPIISEAFRVCLGNSLNLSISPEAIATGTTEFIGVDSRAMVETTSSVSLETDTLVQSPADTGNGPIFAAFDGAVFLGGSSTASAVVTSFEVTVNNNRTTEARVGSKFADCVFDATAQVEGSMTVFFDGVGEYNKFVNETASKVLIVLRDANSKATFAISCPNIKLNGGTIDPPTEGPVTMEMPFRALEGPNGESAIKVVNVNYSA